MVSGSRGLQVSVITSSSSLPLNAFLSAISDDDVDAIELYAFRHVDIIALAQEGVSAFGIAQGEGIRRVADGIAALSERDIERTARWVRRTLQGAAACRGRPFRVSGIATFFPEIVSLSDSLRKVAVEALVNACRLANAIDAGCVEMVTGSRLDTCLCGKFRPGGPCRRIRCTSQEEKLHLLAEGISEVVRRTPDLDVCLAVEMETDPYNVVHDLESLRCLMDNLDPVAAQRSGINLDFAHFFINGVDAADLCATALGGRIINAHISDTAGAHMQDLVPGSYNRIVGPRGMDGADMRSRYMEYAALLWERLRDHANGLPFTGAVSVELEFCDWVDWVRTALRKTSYLLEAARPEPAWPAQLVCHT